MKNKSKKTTVYPRRDANNNIATDIHKQSLIQLIQDINIAIGKDKNDGITTFPIPITNKKPCKKPKKTIKK